MSQWRSNDWMETLAGVRQRTLLGTVVLIQPWDHAPRPTGAVPLKIDICQSQNFPTDDIRLIPRPIRPADYIR
jgi:hypothetical protein